MKIIVVRLERESQTGQWPTVRTSTLRWFFFSLQDITALLCALLENECRRRRRNQNDGIPHSHTHTRKLQCATVKVISYIRSLFCPFSVHIVDLVSFFLFFFFFFFRFFPPSQFEVVAHEFIECIKCILHLTQLTCIHWLSASEFQRDWIELEEKANAEQIKISSRGHLLGEGNGSNRTSTHTLH